MFFILVLLFPNTTEGKVILSGGQVGPYANSLEGDAARLIKEALDTMSDLVDLAIADTFFAMATRFSPLVTGGP